MNSMISYKLLDDNDCSLLICCVKNFRQQDISYQKAKMFLADKHNIVYVALDGDNVVGYLLTYDLQRMDNGSNIYIAFHLFVLEQYRKQGIGKQLLTLLLTKARDEKKHYVMLTTQTDNVAANALYKSMGGYNHPDDKETYFWYLTGKPANDINGPEIEIRQ